MVLKNRHSRTISWGGHRSKAAQVTTFSKKERKMINKYLSIFYARHYLNVVHFNRKAAKIKIKSKNYFYTSL